MKILIVVSGMPALMLKKTFTYLSAEKQEAVKRPKLAREVLEGTMLNRG